MSSDLYAPTTLSAAPRDHTPAYEPADLTTCDREPIHIPGAIQPHGILIAYDADGVITSISANCAEMLGASADLLVGAPLSAALGDSLAARFPFVEMSEGEFGFAEVHLPDGAHGSLAGQRVDARTHRSGPRLVLELEPLSQDSTLTMRDTHRAIASLARRLSVVDIAERLAVEVRELLGFDRVMVYRFDPEWNGEVIAEQKTAELNSFLGLHYPASDIPAQARALYAASWVRLIADIAYTPSPLTPVLDPVTRTPLDLSHASLRSVSPIHLEYLANMGVTASMSISLVVDGELWGLVACHHYTGPHRPSHDSRSAAELLGKVASQMFAEREALEHEEQRFRMLQRQTAMVERVARDPREPRLALLDDPEALDLYAAGALVLYDGELQVIRGEAPPWPVLHRISMLLEEPGAYVTHSDALARMDPDLAEYAHLASGALRIATNSQRWLMWLRPELERTVDWGGDPTNKLLAAREGPDVRLSPRKSFDKWRQVVQERSAPWDPVTLEMVASLGTEVRGITLARGREQMVMAESIQRSVVLPETPDLEGIEVAARYLPDGNFQVGGDWWDTFSLPDGRFAFVVGDVAGHGVEAASTMVQMRTTLRAYLIEGHDPMRSLDKLDAYVDRLLGSQVATAVVALLDPDTGEVELASAGHPPAMVDAGDGLREVAHEHPRPLLGIRLSDPQTQPARFVLEPGVALLLYTDGMVERRDEDVAVSMARLMSADLAIGGQDLESWIERLLSTREPDAADDTTLLAIRRRAPR